MDFVTYLGFTPVVAFKMAAEVLLLMMSAMMSSSEVAFFSLSPADIRGLKQPADLRRLKRAGSMQSESAVRLLEEPDMLLATILVVNNLVNIGIVVLATDIIDSMFCFQRFEFLFTGVLVTFLLLLFGEIMPKIYSAHNTLPFCRMAAPVLSVLRKVFYPLSSLLMHSTFIVNRVVSKENHSISVDELSQALELTDREEIKEERNILQGIIRFGDETAKEVMTSRLDMVDLDIRTPYTQVLKSIVENGYSRMPVYEGSQDNIKGVLYIKDLLPHLNKGDNFRWQSLIRQPYFVPETKKIDDLLCDFQTSRIHMAIVVDEFGGVSGLITLEDIIEEIVGEINDEFDEPDSSYERVDDNTIIFEGKTMLADFFKIMSLDADLFEDNAGEADTLAGLLLEVKGEFPRLHEKIVCGGVEFEVMSKDKHRLKKIKATILQPEGKESDADK